MPFFLDKEIHVEKWLIGTMANFYDVGALIGGLGFGWITDRVGFRSPVLCLMLLTSLPIFGVIQLMTPSIW